MLRKIAISFAVLTLAIVLCLAVGLTWLRNSNLPDRGGGLDEPVTLKILDADVRVKRDRHAIPYIYAETLADAIRMQGFVTAQDRLSQILLTRELVNGRLAEQIGEAGLRSDILIRVIGLNRLGRTWAAQLESPSLELHEWYLQGVNAYIATREDEFPLAVRLSPDPPKPFTLEDLTAQYLFLAFNSTGNWRTELLSQALVDHLGAERAAEISMLTVNPDDGSEWASDYSLAANPVPLPWNNPGKEGFQPSTRTGCPRSQRVSPAHRRSGAPLPKLPASGAFPQLPEPADGSNSWAMSGPRSAGGAPILANDPHIDARRLPGIWHPVGLITPQWRAVGAAGAGFPGLGVGRSDHIAWGVTNAYSDVADLFIEQEDPEREGHYLEGEQSLPFRVVEETIRVRDRSAPGGYRELPLTIRYTRRGPIISDHGLTIKDGRLYSLRWSVAENVATQTQIGIEGIMLAGDVQQAREVIRRSMRRSTTPWRTPRAISHTTRQAMYPFGAEATARFRFRCKAPMTNGSALSPSTRRLHR